MLRLLFQKTSLLNMASPSLVVDQAEEMLGEIRMLDSKFRKSCDQILLLNNQIEDLQVRYDRYV